MEGSGNGLVVVIFWLFLGGTEMNYKKLQTEQPVDVRGSMHHIQFIKKNPTRWNNV